MKKIMTILAIFIIAAGLCGCDLARTLTLTEPDTVVNDFFWALKNKNEDILILYTENEDINMLLHSKGKEEDLDLLYESLFKNFTYKVD